jgi:DNA-binding transcriptional MerR regulator
MQQYRIREFAALTGVTVRTLHHYDEAGLPHPSARTGSGYRLYSEQDMGRLQQITTLKFLGFSLRQIAELLTGRDVNLAATLRLQKELLLGEQQKLHDALLALERAESMLSQSGQPDWHDLRQLIEVMKMKQPSEEQLQWAKKHFTTEQLEEIAQRDTPEVRERGQREWQELIAEVEAAAHTDPTTPHAIALAQRWRALIEQFTGGNRKIESNLKQMYTNKENHPQGFRRPWSDAAQTFIAAAMKAAKEQENHS